MRKLLLSAAWSLLLMLPAAAQWHPAQLGATSAGPDNQTGRSFVQAMLMIDRYEAAAGRMALRRSWDPAIRDLGRDLIRKHNAMAADLNQVSDRTLVGSIITPPPAFDPEHQRMFLALETAPAAAFDRAFVSQQVEIHREALDFARGYEEHGNIARLQEHARQMVPVFHENLALVQRLGGGGLAAN